MSAIEGAKRAARVLQDTPVVPVMAAAIGVAASVVVLAGSIPIAGALLGPLVGLVYVFVEPYLACGFLGLVDEAIDGPVTVDTFVARANEHYGDMLVARLVLLVPLIVYELLVGGISTAVMTALRFGVDSLGDPGLVRFFRSEGVDALLAGLDPVVLALWLVGALVLLLVTVAGVLLQFYPAAIVVGGAGPLESVRYSFEFVREHPRSVLGYTLLSALGGIVLILPSLGRVAVEARTLAGGGPPGGSFETALAGQVTGVVVYLLGFLVAKTLVVALVRTYYVAFVRTTLDSSRTA